jgi:hypothetical protein
MPRSEYRAYQVSAKTNEVVKYHKDYSLPGKPLHILIPGGLIALAALSAIILVIYKTWLQNQLMPTTGGVLIGVLSPFYIGGVFLFSYGYELYNIPRATRLTAIIVFVTLAAFVIVAVFTFLLGALAKGFSSSSSSSNKSSESSGSSSTNSSTTSNNYFSASSSSSSSGSSSSSSSGGGGSLFFINTGDTTTREVVKEKIVEVPVAPRTIDCPYCERSYVPADHKYLCPSCAAATPKESIEESESPKERNQNTS